MVMAFGEITTTATVNYEQIVRDACKNIGYDAEDKGLDFKSCNVVIQIEAQSPEIANAVYVDKNPEDIGAGD
jgi:S-adenosylmethionine synthetase